MPPLHLLIKPASGNCNLRCRYCFYSDVAKNRSQSSYGIMTKDTLKSVIQKALLFAEQSCTIAFQGGEPTLAGLDFYKQLIEYCKQYNTKSLPIQFAIQTNGYRLGEEWVRFFSDHRFLVGISLDGTIHTHDAYRRTADDVGTFAEIMKTIELLKAHQVDFNILTVVNKKTAASISKIYKFYNKNHFNYLQFIPCLDPFGEEAGTMPYSLTPEIYGRFLCDLFDLWYEDFMNGQGISIRQFDNYLSILLYGHGESCDMNGTCSIQNVIEADGEVYPCDFYVLDSYKLGNLNDTDFREINERRAQSGFIEASFEKDSGCTACPYYNICRGGCRRYRNMAGDIASRNYFCKAYVQFFDHSLDRLVKLAGMIRK